MLEQSLQKPTDTMLQITKEALFRFQRKGSHKSLLGLVVVIALLGFGFGVVDGTDEPTPPEPLKIGYLADYSGPLAEYGAAIELGVKLAVEQINAAGGINGQPVTYVTGDTALGSGMATAEARRLIDVEGVSAIVGPLESSIALAVAEEVAADAQIPVVSPYATWPNLTNANDNGYLFRTSRSSASEGVVLANNLVEADGVDNVAVVYVNNPYGAGLSGAFEDNFDGTVTRVPYKWGATSYLAELQAAAANGAEALVIVGYSESQIILRESIANNLFKTYYFVDGNRSEDLAAAVGAQNVEGLRGVAPSTGPATDSSLAWFAAYKERHGPFSDTFYGGVREAYDAVVAIALAAEAANSVEGPAIRNQLQSVASPGGLKIIASQASIEQGLRAVAQGTDVDYEGAASSVNWNEAGDLSSGYVDIWEFQNGIPITQKTIPFEYPDTGIIPIPVTSTVALTLGVPNNGDVSADCSPNCDSLAVGTIVSVTAVPDSGYELVGWECTGSCPSDRTATTVSFTVSQDTMITPILMISTVALTLGNSNNGSVSADCTPNCDTLAVGTTVTVTAVLDSGYELVGWECTGSCPSGTATTVSFTISQDTMITPILMTSTVALTLGNPSNGSVSVDCTPNCDTLAVGTTVTVTAVLDSGYELIGWECTGSCPSGTATTVSFTVSQDTMITPILMISTVALTLGTPSNGSVSADCTPNCDTLAVGTTVTVTAVLDSGYELVGWECTGSCPSGTATTVSFTVSRDTIITPILMTSTVALTLGTPSNGSVLADCTPNCDTLAVGMTVTVTVVPDSGYELVGWECTGSCPSGTATTVSFTVSRDTMITPILMTSKVVLTLGDPINGSVSADCSPNCDTLAVGTTVTVTAVPDSGYELVGWECTGSCPSGTATTVSFTVSQDTMITPILMTSKVALTLGDPINGSVSADCTPNCDTLAVGMTVTVTAVPDSGYEFVGWECTGSCPSDGTTITVSFTISRDTMITPVFGDIGAPDDHGDNLANATEIGIGSSIEGELALKSGGQDLDYFRVVVSETATLAFYTSGSIDTVGRLFASDGVSVIADDDQGGAGDNFRIARELAPGTYYVEVRPSGLSDEGGYTLVVADLLRVTIYLEWWL